MSRKKVEGHPELKKEIRSGAIINSNQNSYSKYMMEYDRKKTEKERIAKMESQLDSINSDINEIKKLLSQLLK